MTPLQTSITWVQVATFVVSGLALLVSLGVAVRTDRRAVRTEKSALEAATSTLWSDAIEATLRVMTDPSRDDWGDRFQTVGVRYTAVVDGLQHWVSLDKWLSAETQLAAALRYQAVQALKTGPTQEDAEQAMGRFADWCHAMSQNLRHFRNTGYSEPALQQLIEHADESAKTIRQRYNLPDPGSDSKVEPLPVTPTPQSGRWSRLRKRVARKRS